MLNDLQKANILKRLSAFIFDIIILSIAATGFLFLVSWFIGYDSKSAELESYLAKYENKYGVTLNITEDEYAALPESSKESYDNAYAALMQDEGMLKTYESMMTMILVMVTVSFFLAVMVLEFVIPLIFGNGQTLGKKLFSLGVMNINHVKLSPPQLGLRTIVGKFAIEIMVPAYIITMILLGRMGILGVVILILMAVLELVVMGVTKTDSMIHDLIAGTVVIDFPSQYIFDTEEEMQSHCSNKNLNEEKKTE